jgi:hypothetical protein
MSNLINIGKVRKEIKNEMAVYREVRIIVPGVD